MFVCDIFYWENIPAVRFVISNIPKTNFKILRCFDLTFVFDFCYDIYWLSVAASELIRAGLIIYGPHIVVGVSSSFTWCCPVWSDFSGA